MAPQPPKPQNTYQAERARSFNSLRGGKFGPSKGGKSGPYQGGRTGTAAGNFQRTRDGASFVPYQRGEFQNYPPVPCTDEEFYTILDQWIADGIVKPLEARPDLTDEDKKNPQYCRYHQYVSHPTPACKTLRRIFHAKINDGTLELSSQRQTIDSNPLPRHKGKEVVAMVGRIGKDSVDEDGNDVSHIWKNDPKPSDGIWESNRGCDKAFWRKYSALRRYLDPFPSPTGWGDNLEEGSGCQHSRGQENPSNSELLINHPRNNKMPTNETVDEHAPNYKEEIYADLSSFCEIPHLSKWDDSSEEIFHMDEDSLLPSKSVFEHGKDPFLDEWSEESFKTKMKMPDFPPPHLINTPSVFLNSDLPPKKRRLLTIEDTRESVGSNQEEGAIENLIFNFDASEDYSNSQQLMEIVYDNSVGQEENVSMVIHDVEDEASPS